MSYKAFEKLQKHFEVEFLKTRTYEEINDMCRQQHEKIKELESRLAVYERAAEVFLKYELFKRPKHWLCRAVRQDNEVNSYTRGKTTEEALKAALKEVEDED